MYRQNTSGAASLGCKIIYVAGSSQFSVRFVARRNRNKWHFYWYFGRFGLAGSFMLKYAPPPVDFVCRLGPRLRPASMQATQTMQAKKLKWAPRDLQHKLKARAMHINSNLDRRIKPNDFNYTDGVVNLSCRRNELKLCQQRDYKSRLWVCVCVTLSQALSHVQQILWEGLKLFKFPDY